MQPRRALWWIGGTLWIVVLGARNDAGVALAQSRVPAPPPAATPPPADDVVGDAASELDDADSLSREEAVGRYEQLLERRPLHAQAFAGVVKHYADQGKLADLVLQYEEKVRSLPDSTGLKIVLTRLYMRAGQPEKAAALIDQMDGAAANLGRDEQKWLVLEAEVFQKVNRLDEAQRILADASRKAKTISERLRLAEALADLHLAAGNKEEAAAALTKLAGEFRESYPQRKRITDALAQRDLHEQAVSQLREMLPLTDGKTDQRCETLRQLGRSLERLHRTQEAIAAYSEAVNLLAGGHWLQQELHERIVTLYRASNRLEDLVQYCRAQIDRAPEQTGMRLLLADVLAAAGDADGARSSIEEAARLFPKDRLISERRVQLLDRLGDSAGAAAEYERIISQIPDDAELYIAYGQYLAGNKQLGAARGQWRHVLSKDLSDASLAFRLGALFEPFDLVDDAVECYERAIQIDARRPEPHGALARLWFVRGEKEKVLATLQRMAEAAPEDASQQAAVCQVAAGLGLTDEALAAIEKACRLAPEQPDYQSARADLLVRAGKLDESLQVRRAALDLLKQPGQQAQAINVLVSMYASARRLDQLKAAEQARIAADPKDLLALLLLANAADIERDSVEARKRLDAILALDATHEAARGQLARLLEATGDIDNAIVEYRRLIDLHPGRARQWYQAIADLKLRFDDRAGAVETFTRIVQTSPGNATVLKDVAEQLARMGEPEKAIDYYEQSLRLQPDRHEIRLQLANTLNDAGRLEDALAAYKAVALQRADRESAHDAMGRLHDVVGRLGVLEDLLDELQALVETNPEDTPIAHTLAALMIREYEYTRAMELIDLVLRSQPRDPALHLVRGELLRRLARFDDALETYRRVLRFPDIDRDYVLGEMGKAAFEAGRIEQARGFWRQIANKLYAGTLLRNNGLLNDAIEILNEGIRLKPDDYGLHRNLIRSLSLAGKTDEALEASGRLLDLEPDNVQNIRDLAKAYLERGNRVSAAEIASRLFSAAVAQKHANAPAAQPRSMGGSVFAMSMQATWATLGWGGGGGGNARTNLGAAVQFFQENGLRGELEEVLHRQIELQPDNALLKLTAATFFSEIGKLDLSLRLFRELETAQFPTEHQAWLGQCSQRDYFRLCAYRLIASKPALRDARLAQLEKRPDAELTRDELIELAVVRQSQGSSEKAIQLLDRAIALDRRDTVALSALVNLLIAAERFRDAEAPLGELAAITAAERARLEAELIERMRRSFVRTLPLALQLRATDDLLREVAQKWTQGQSVAGDYAGRSETIGYSRARMLLATIYAKTDRMSDARKIWQEQTPTHPADVDGWTVLAGVVQFHGQDDLALDYYQKAMLAARVLAGDPLYQQVFSNAMSQNWFGGEDAIDSSFSRIAGTFSSAGRLLELYDFLRDSEQLQKARQIATQYDLWDTLKAEYQKRLLAARADFRSGSEDLLQRSVPYLIAACKLAELYDQTGDWPSAERVYQQYVEDFPDELGLLQTLSEVAERQGESEHAIEWEKQVVACKERLARKTREWRLRQLPLTPQRPQVLGGGSNDWDWQRRWGRSPYWGGMGGAGPLDVSASWIRIAQLQLAVDNPIAAANALERAINSAGTERESVSREALALVNRRQLGPKMLSVLRAVAVQLPREQGAQLAFADSLLANDRRPAAAEVYRRMLRHGVSDLGMLTVVRQHLAELDPAAASAEDDSTTVEKLEQEAAADTSDAGAKLRLARAYYYSLRLDDALACAKQVADIAPHLDGLHDLLIEIYTVKGDSAHVIEALKTKIQRTSNDDQNKATARRRLADELLFRGETDAALELLKELADPRDPGSYESIGILLQYFGKHEESLAQFEKASRSGQASVRGGDNRGAMMQVRAKVLQNDIDGAASAMMSAIDQQSQQSMQVGGIAAIWSGQEQPLFQPYVTLMILEPRLADAIDARLVKQYERDKSDPAVAKLLYEFYRLSGRRALAESLLAEMAGRDVADQSLVTRLVDQAIEKRQYAQAISLATKFIDEQPKPLIPPGMPPQLVGMVSVMSPRNLMICKLGDVYWKQGDKAKALETYRRIVDEQVDESRLAFAMICMTRDNIPEAEKIVAQALSGQEIKTPGLLQFRAVLRALDGHAESVFDDLAKAAEIGSGQSALGWDDGDPSDAARLLGELARQTGQLPKFQEFMNKRLQKNPNSWSDYLLLAEVLRSAEKFADALAVLEQALSNKAIRPQALEQKIQWLADTTSPEELVRLNTELLTLAEKQTSSDERRYGRSDGVDARAIRERLGSLQWRMELRDDAIATWTARQDQKSADTFVQLAARLSQRGDDVRAAAAFRKALALQPDNSNVRRALAESCYHSGARAEALAHLREVFLSQYAATARRSQPSFNPYEDGAQNQQTWSEDRVERIWAMDLISDPNLSEYLAKCTPDEARDTRLALAVFTGDWVAVGRDLETRLKDQPYDPLGWTLAAQLRERRSDWAGAIQAWEMVRRLQLTTIADHRKQLKLILAGRQVKDAAGGDRSGNAAQLPAPGQPAMRAGYRRGRYGWYGNSANETTQHLVALYLKVGDHKQAERARLVDQQENIASRLPELSNMLWQRGLRERALELSRLGLTLGDNAYGMPQHAALLAESGALPQAIALLVQSYRFLQDENPFNAGYYAMMYGGMSGAGGANAQAQLESGTEARISEALYEALQKAGALDQTIAELQQRCLAAPDDERLARLVLSLLTRSRDWSAAASTVAAFRAKRPHDAGLASAAMEIQCQSGDWDAALATLGELRAEAPQHEDRWRFTEAFIRLMKTDRAGAAAAIEAVVSRPVAVVNRDSIIPIAAVLTCAGEYRKLIDYLETHRAVTRLDDSTVSLLVRLRQLDGSWDEAFATAADQLWNSGAVLKLTDPLVSLAAECAVAAKAAGKPIKGGTRPENAALATLLSDGVTAGRKAFEELVQRDGANIAARRGLVQALEAAGDPAAAVRANQELLDRLAPLRGQRRLAPLPGSAANRIRAYLEQMRVGRENSAMALSVGMQFAGTLQQLFGEPPDQAAQDTIYTLWRAYQNHQAQLLIAAGSQDSVPGLFKSLADRNAIHAESAESNSYSNYRRYASSFYNYRGDFDDEMDGAAPGDWKARVRRAYDEAHLFGPLAAEFESLASRVPPGEWSLMSETFAALGRTDEAGTVRGRAVSAALTNLRADAGPSLGTDRYSWGWYGGLDRQESWRLVWALSLGLSEDPQDDPEDSMAWERPYSLSEYARDEAVSGAVSGLDELVGVGWGECGTVRQLVEVYGIAREPQRVISLLERAFTPEELARSQMLGGYLNACIAAKDFDRAQKTIDTILSRNSGLSDKALLARLVIARLRNDSAADQFEADLLKRARAPRRNPCPPSERLDSDGPSMPPHIRYQFARNQRYRYETHSAFPDLRQAAVLAEAMQVPYAPEIDQFDVTLENIAEAYARVRLYDHAARIGALVLQNDAAGPSPRTEAKIKYAAYLARTGQTEAAKAAAGEVESALLTEIKSRPANFSDRRKLIQLYQSRPFGRDFAKAAALLRESCELSPVFDAHGVEKARCDFELGRYDDASKAFAAARARGAILEVRDLYRAGLAAARTGARQAALEPLRVALWRSPKHPLAAAAREVVRE